MIKKWKNAWKNVKKKAVIADGLLVAAMMLIFGTTYDIEPHIGLYVLAFELVAAAIMIARSRKS